MEACIDISRLSATFAIDAETGVITRLVSAQGCPAGREVGCLDGKGYRRVRVFGKSTSGHQLAWALYYGAWPEGSIDHVNGIRDDNRKLNLRLATASQNACNRGMAANNTSGHKGVTWNKHAKKWMALIKVGGRSKTLGYRDDIESAADLYKQAAEKYHGEFART